MLATLTTGEKRQNRGHPTTLLVPAAEAVLMTDMITLSRRQTSLLFKSYLLVYGSLKTGLHIG